MWVHAHIESHTRTHTLAQNSFIELWMWNASYMHKTAQYTWQDEETELGQKFTWVDLYPKYHVEIPQDWSWPFTSL